MLLGVDFDVFCCWPSTSFCHQKKEAWKNCELKKLLAAKFSEEETKHHNLGHELGRFF